MKKLILLVALFIGTDVAADTVVPARTIRANTLISETDVTFANVELPNGYARLSDVIGQEARVALYAGRPILIDDIGPPAIIARNQVVPLTFTANGIRIHTEGRALERGAVGDRIRVMNLSSRTTLFGQVLADGSLQVRN